jgi:hypothetical protein
LLNEIAGLLEIPETVSLSQFGLPIKMKIFPERKLARCAQVRRVADVPGFVSNVTDPVRTSDRSSES